MQSLLEQILPCEKCFVVDSAAKVRNDGLSLVVLLQSCVFELLDEDVAFIETEVWGRDLYSVTKEKRSSEISILKKIRLCERDGFSQLKSNRQLKSCQLNFNCLFFNQTRPLLYSEGLTSHKNIWPSSS